MPLSNPGYCPICRADTTFTATGAWLRDCYVCARCKSIPRQRALVRILDWVRPGWREMKVHESSPTLMVLAEQCADYSCSFYFEDVASGQHKDSLRSENLEALTFPDHTFDIVITQDVLEHVLHPDRALAEIMRVLRIGGAHIFTTPKHKDLLRSRPRVRLDATGMQYLCEPVYHGNPIGDGQSLVTWDFGVDFEARLDEWNGYLTSTHVLHDRQLGLDGEFMEVFVTVKHPANSTPALTVR